MALIICPECQREISDQVKSCPHCGYPLKNEEVIGATAPSEGEISLALHFKRNKKRTIIAALLLALAIIVTIGIGKFLGRDRYIDNLIKVRYEMLMGGAEAERLVNLTRDVWYDTIHKRDRDSTADYTHFGFEGYRGGFYTDFNDSIQSLYSADETLLSIQVITESRSKVSKLMQSLRNPSKEFSEYYDIVSEMYDAYFTLTELAISPSGSLSSFTSNANEADSSFMISYNKLENQLPEEWKNRSLKMNYSAKDESTSIDDTLDVMPDYSDYSIYPKRASGIIRSIDEIETPPETIFSTLASENGLEGTMFKIYGEVTSQVDASEDNGNSDAVIVHTDDGDAYIADLYTLMIQEFPGSETDELTQRFALPSVGEKVCVYVEYVGYSETLAMPFFCLGGQEVVARVLSTSMENNLQH